MKRTVAVRDDKAEQDGNEHKRAKEEADNVDTVIELSCEDFECIICCGEESTAALQEGAVPEDHAFPEWPLGGVAVQPSDGGATSMEFSRSLW